MNQEVEAENRTLVVITDPQVQAKSVYPVYSKANRAFFMHDCKREVFYGNCWPGKSTWGDLEVERTQQPKGKCPPWTFSDFVNNAYIRT